MTEGRAHSRWARPVSVGVRARNANGAGPWVNSAWAQPPAPDPVSNITVAHNVASLTVTRDASVRATAYDVTYSGGGVNARVAWNRAGTTLDITCDIRYEGESRNCVSSEHPYTVGVRAWNAAGESYWRNSAEASYSEG